MLFYLYGSVFICRQPFGPDLHSLGAGSGDSVYFVSLYEADFLDLPFGVGACSFDCAYRRLDGGKGRINCGDRDFGFGSGDLDCRH